MTPRKILFIASQYSWMEPYTQSAVRDLWNDRCHLIYAAEFPAQTGAFDWLPASQVTEYRFFERPWLERKLFHLHPTRLISIINRRIAEMQPDLVIALTIDTDLSFYLPRLQKRVPVLYVVHNARLHAKHLTSLRARLKREILLLSTQRRLNAGMQNQIVHSRWSADYILSQHPDHRICFLPFPTLVTDEIARGTDAVPELDGESGYLLFFGRVEKYKGVERAIRLLEQSSLLADRKLVIAGRGELSSPIPESIAGRVIRINRFVPDSQVASLFRNAAVIVYPYIAATQTGVISIAAYFGKPIVASPQEYFREIGEGEPGMTLVDCDDIPQFERAVYDACTNPADSTPIYTHNYTTRDWRAPLDTYLTSLGL